jgi:hypothetical protein
MRLHDCGKSGIEIAFTRRFHDQDLPPDGATCCLYVSQLKLELRLVRVSQDRDDGGFWSELVAGFLLLSQSGERPER